MSIRCDKGTVLVMVMISTLVLSILGAALLSVAINEYRMVTVYRDWVTAYYLAEAGMERVIHHITGIYDIETGLSTGDTWNMSVNPAEESSLLVMDGNGNITVSVASKEYCGSVYDPENPEIIFLYKYTIVLQSVAHFQGITRQIECILAVEDDNEDVVDDVDNLIKIEKWRQII